MHRYIKLLLWIIFFEGVSITIGLLTNSGLDPWYTNLNRSSLTPPGYVFSIVWPILYAMLATVAFILFDQDKKIPQNLIILFTIQMLMNWTWTPFFFHLHWISFSALWLLALTALNFVLIIQAGKQHKVIAWLLLPYTIWLCFASYLNIVIALTN